MFQRTVRLERFAPGLSKSITWKIGKKLKTSITQGKQVDNLENKTKIMRSETSTTQSYLLVVDFEVGGFYYEGSVIFSFFQLVEQVDERPVNIFSKSI